MADTQDPNNPFSPPPKQNPATQDPFGRQNGVGDAQSMGAPGATFPPSGSGLPPAGLPGAGFSSTGGAAGSGFPQGNFPGAGFPPPPPQEPEDTTPANFQLGTKLPKVINVKIPAHSLQFDEQYFLHLLAGSISLSRDEKARIIESIPKLRQSQVDELIRIFEEEQRKFAELPAKHVEQLKKLDAQHYQDWTGIELQQKQDSKKNEDEAKAEAIRKQLGL